MTKLSLKEGRIHQKLKTRTRILRAAKQLLSQNKKITLEDVAAKAQISRATIYRYFPNIDLLSSEASLDLHFLSPEELNDKVKSFPLEKRILFIQKYYNELAQQHELLFRRYLSTALNESITSKKKIRGARRLGAMQLITNDFKKELSKKNREQLNRIATILMGIEPMIVAKDVCDLNNKETSKTLAWGMKMILKGLERDGS